MPTLAEDPESWCNPDGADVPNSDPSAKYEPFPGSPCKLCCPDSVAANGQPGQEWCREANACAATIDWERIYGV